MVRDFKRILGRSLDHPEVQMVIGSLGGHLTADALDVEFSVEIPDRGIAFKFDDKSRLSSVLLAAVHCAPVMAARMPPPPGEGSDWTPWPPTDGAGCRARLSSSPWCPAQFLRGE